MRFRLSLVASLIASCAIIHAQVIHVNLDKRAPDVWANYYGRGHKLTFSGKVKDLIRSPAISGGENYVAAIVKNFDGGGDAVVEMGPASFVDHQVAKVNIGDVVQVTGSKVMLRNRGIIIASMIRVDGQGGPVLALRRPSGIAYWPAPLPVATAPEPLLPNTDENAIAEQDQQQQPPYAYPPQVYSLNNGLLNIDTGPQWYWNNQSYNVGNGVNVVTGPYPITVGPTWANLPNRFRF